MLFSVHALFLLMNILLIKGLYICDVVIYRYLLIWLELYNQFLYITLPINQKQN